MMLINVWWTVIALILPLCSVNSEPTCLENNVNVAPTKVFYVGRDLNITIEVSNRVTHKLVSQILIILLKEVLGYADVHLVSTEGGNSISTLQQISGCKIPEKCPEKSKNFVPNIMINVEVWLGPGNSTEKWVQTGNVADCGPLGPIGRTGWYLSLSFVHKLWQENNTILDHWRAFQKEEIASLFDITEKELKRYAFYNNKKYYCQFPECENSYYKPPQCRRPNVICATLLSDYSESSFTVLKSEIDHLQLLVKVLWVGPNLENIVHDRTSANKPILFYNWKPNTVTSIGNFTNVAFPHCEDKFSLQRGKTCEHDVNQLEKIIWSKIKTNAPDIYQTIRAMTFRQDDYFRLLETYTQLKPRGVNIFGTACTWITQNQETWHEWVPETYLQKPILYIGGIFPMNGTYWQQSGVIPAAQIAIDAVNKNQNILNQYKLTLLVNDGQCAADEVMKSFIGYVTNSTYKDIIGILGPACSDTVEPIAGVAKHYNTIIISYSAEGALINDQDKYPYFFRTIPENSQFRHVYLQLFKQLNWKSVAALTEDGQKYPEYISLVHNLLQENGLNFITNSKFPRDRVSHNMTQYLLDLKGKKAKIIIGDFYDYAARSVMCEAYKQGMIARNGYQWFLPLWFQKNWFDTDFYNSNMSHSQENVQCTTKQMMEAINGHMSLAYKFYGDDDVIMQEQKSIGAWKEYYKQIAKTTNRPTSMYGGYAYDAVWVYAYALDALLKENHTHVANLHSDETSRRFAELLNKTNFTGVSGHVYFEGSSRISEILVWQWRDNKTYKIGLYTPEGSDSGNLELNESAIVWLTADKKKPNDGSEGKMLIILKFNVTLSTNSHYIFIHFSLLSYILEPSSCHHLEFLQKALGVSCSIAVVIANLFGFFILAVLMLIIFIIFKHKYEQKMKSTEARMRELGLIKNSNLLTLDEWEMPRDHIVINRKLGEGAFGTVYGGEAFITDKGWIAVAVKTLKIGATVEEKLDFLSEAEMMKKFDHKNIVQLIGVCTSGEPVYTVMEFMLYGDLKTYLLGRRHLVNDREREKSDEVSDQRLTNIALDIARGLSYLAELKYVHRDLACRNCLVNACRTVKIADFGMCRPMFDSDYYRFNKRGMLPVRWMAPESLIDGIFTPTSDIWSYGVLLYEIITFGSFPYQGLSNNQVLEYVKGFNTLPVPNGCKPELASLLLQCWSRRAQDRPSASEIVEILAHHSNLISPCLDMPMASVEVEDTDSIEIAINERTRLHSVSENWPQKRQNGSVDQTIKMYKETHELEDIERKFENSPALDSPCVLGHKGQYLTLQNGPRGDSDYGSDVSQDFPQTISFV
ncbi:uncharacterized protein [Centruroides vittatus]